MLAAQGGDCIEQFAPWSDRQTEFVNIRFREQRQEVEVDLLLRERWRIFAQAETGEPVGEIGHGASSASQPIRRPVGRASPSPASRGGRVDREPPSSRDRKSVV